MFSTAPTSGIVSGSRDTDIWWRTAVVYQVYPCSFFDGNCDGVGDLAGLRGQLGYLSDLGVDAIWINPWYPSPMVDAGYDVADYRDIEPRYGTLTEAELLISEAHAIGIRVIADIVPNHVSSEHAWFKAALRDEPGARERFIFRPGRGPGGTQPPNDWVSNFGGPAWTRVSDGQWYLHLFSPAQPDLNWASAQVRVEFEDILRFWFDRGLDGFRIDVAHALTKDPELPDAGERLPGSQHTSPHPAYDQDAVHDVYRGWRKIADSYDPARVFVAEAWVPTNERLARYLRPDELHTAFQFDFLRAPWNAGALRRVIEDALAQAAAVGAPATWVLGNHDVVRVATRYARAQPDHLIEADWDRARWASEPANLDVGRRRARAAALLQLALPGTAYIYQGEELGLEEYETLPHDRRLDPIWSQSGHTDVGRDGCRVPLPFNDDVPPYGFSSGPATSTWLPQPPGWGPLTVAAQKQDPNSTLALYRQALAIRRSLFGNDSPVDWILGDDGALAFGRAGAQCWVNTGTAPIPLPPSASVVVASDPTVHDHLLPPDSAVWLTERQS